jgi:hypothetical protein
MRLTRTRLSQSVIGALSAMILACAVIFAAAHHLAG